MLATEQIAIEEDITTPRRDSSLTAWVNVIYGCNEKCTYCVVPSTRGQEQSRRPEDIRREMMALGEAGEGGGAVKAVDVLREARASLTSGEWAEGLSCADGCQYQGSG